jgi:hypothetical protein
MYPSVIARRGMSCGLLKFSGGSGDVYAT